MVTLIEERGHLSELNLRSGPSLAQMALRKSVECQKQNYELILTSASHAVSARAGVKSQPVTSSVLDLRVSWDS